MHYFLSCLLTVWPKSSITVAVEAASGLPNRLCYSPGCTFCIDCEKASERSRTPRVFFSVVFLYFETLTILPLDLFSLSLSPRIGAAGQTCPPLDSWCSDSWCLWDMATAGTLSFPSHYIRGDGATRTSTWMLWYNLDALRKNLFAIFIRVSISYVLWKPGVVYYAWVLCSFFWAVSGFVCFGEFCGGFCSNWGVYGEKREWLHLWNSQTRLIVRFTPCQLVLLNTIFCVYWGVDTAGNEKVQGVNFCLKFYLIQKCYCLSTVKEFCINKKTPQFIYIKHHFNKHRYGTYLAFLPEFKRVLPT